MTSVQNYNIIITGDKNSGKTSLVNKLVTGNLVGFPTSLNEKVVKLTYKTKRVVNECTFTFVEKSRVDVEKADDSFPCNGLIVMFDVCKEGTEESLNYYLRNMDGKVPVVICGNKSDNLERKKEVNCEKYPNSKYFLCSVKEGKGLDDVLLSFLKRFSGDMRVKMV